jgi:hypothetical protein
LGATQRKACWLLERTTHLSLKGRHWFFRQLRGNSVIDIFFHTFQKVGYTTLAIHERCEQEVAQVVSLGCVGTFLIDSESQREKMILLSFSFAFL